RELEDTRPTAVNLRWAIDRSMRAARRAATAGARTAALRREAQAICDEDVEISLGIGRHGLPLIEAVAERKAGGPVNILTHCNAGALATINWGTATAPIYLAHRKGIDMHVWVDETRPRNQGSLTAWELAQNGVPHTVIVDNAGGHLMQHGLVDLCITGTDRTTRTGDVANKVGTYLKALAAADNGVPFYVALPSTTIDWTLEDGLASIPIEERGPEEVSVVRGMAGDDWVEVRTLPESTPVRNIAFDVTPARLVTGLITERGVCEASERGLAALFPERARRASRRRRPWAARRAWAAPGSTRATPSSRCTGTTGVPSSTTRSQSSTAGAVRSTRPASSASTPSSGSATATSACASAQAASSW